jgi:L-alanine-DL-glutamate epimerase-like enolase superfamily enzyme
MTLIDGKVSPSSRPGLGIEINREALEYYAAVARESYQPR